MLKLRTMLTCILFLGSMGTSQAGPLDSPDTVYIDGLPCSRSCQSYMGWYRRVPVSRQTAPVAAQLPPSQPAQQAPKARAQRATQIRENRPNSAPPIRVAKKAAPKPVEVPPAKIGDLRPADSGEAKSAPLEKITDSPPISNPASGSDAGTTPQPVATAPAVQDLTTAPASPAPEQKAESDTKPSGPAEAISAADTETKPARSAAGKDCRFAARGRRRGEIRPSRKDRGFAADIKSCLWFRCRHDTAAGRDGPGGGGPDDRHGQSGTGAESQKQHNARWSRGSHFPC